MGKPKKADVEIYADLTIDTYEHALKELDGLKIFEVEEWKPWHIPTHSIALDVALGGGLPGAGITEVAGQPWQGKTTMVAEMEAAYLAWHDDTRPVYHQDAERRNSVTRFSVVMARFGFDLATDQTYVAKLRRYLYHRTKYAEDAKKTALRLIASGGVGLYTIDSVAAIRTRREVEKAIEGGKDPLGLHAATVSDFVNKTFSLASQHKTTWLIVNQDREPLNLKGPLMARAGKETTGGKMLKFMAMARLVVSKGNPRDKDKKTQSKLWNCFVRVRKNASSGWHGKIGLDIREDSTFKWEEETITYARKYELTRDDDSTYHMMEREQKKTGARYRATSNGEDWTKWMLREGMIEWVHNTPSFRKMVRIVALENEVA